MVPIDLSGGPPGKPVHLGMEQVREALKCDFSSKACHERRWHQDYQQDLQHNR